MSHPRSLASLLCVIALLITVPARAASPEGGRLALVLGNGAYDEIGALTNPSADASLIASTLIDLGFDTTLAIDSNQNEMKRHIADFGRRLRAADKDTIGFFFYAGHGVQARGRNYLLPVEASPSDEADLDLMGVEANWVLRQMESAGNRTNVIVLDACRNNPFVASSRSMSRGLAQIDAPTGSFISYATAPGKTALDGDGVNSPFTRALAAALPSAGAAIEQVFKQVRVNVIRDTDGAQTPWDSSSLVDDVVLRPDGTGASPVGADQAETSLWQSTRARGDIDAIALFLQAYPQGAFSEQARALLIESLMKSNADEETAAADATDDASDDTPAISSETVETGSVPTLEEQQNLLAGAHSAASPDAYRQYLDRFPDGAFADLARAELDALELALANTSSPPRETIPVVSGSPAEKVIGPIRFNTLLAGIDPADSPRSIAQLSQGSPLFPPFEGLDEVHWKEQDCSNCHDWQPDSLCTQGEFYTADEEEGRTSRIEHPYGGFFKRTLERWASEGCLE